MKYISCILIISLMIFHPAVSAQDGFFLNVDLGSAISSEKDLPFWFYKNSRGRVSEDSDLFGTLSLGYDYQINENLLLQFKGGTSYDNGAYNDKFWVDELYARLEYLNKIELVIGKRQKQEFLRGLSASNNNFAWSVNTRAIPGLQLSLIDPVYFDRWKSFGFLASWQEYLLEDDRAVSRAHLHHKNFYLVYNKSAWQVKVGIEHFAMYGGTSEEYGDAPSGLKNYVKVFFGREGGKDAIGGERQNVIGNHLGTYVLDLTYKPGKYKYNFIYNHFFEDGSGTKFSNFPDGRYALYVEDVENRNFWNAFIAEVYYTKNRSKNYHGAENVEQYFNNFLFYKSGWSYKKRVLGVAFFSFDATAPRGSILNDEFVAYHLGMEAELKPFNRGNTFPFKLLLTNVNYSNQTRRTEKTKSNVFYTYLDFGLLQGNPFNVNVSFGTEFSEGDTPIFAAGLSVSKSIF